MPGLAAMQAIVVLSGHPDLSNTFLTRDRLWHARSPRRPATTDQRSGDELPASAERHAPLHD